MTVPINQKKGNGDNSGKKTPAKPTQASKDQILLNN